MIFNKLIKEFEKELDIKNNFDLVKKEIKINENVLFLYYLTSLIDVMQFDYLIESIFENKKINDFINNNRVSSIIELNTNEKALYFLYSGAVILFSKDDKKIISIDIRKYPTRSIQEPDIEKGIRTSKDGFVETLLFNIALIRRRIKSSNLKIKHYVISKESKQSLCIFYMDNVVNKNILRIVEKRISEIDINSLVMSEKVIEELVLDSNKSIFPIVKYTERPDVSSIQILNGKIGILVDTSSTMLLIPCNLFDNLRHVEEFKESYILGSFTRLIRTIGVFLSVFLLPLYICLIKDNSINNGIILITKSKEINTPLSLQIIFLIIFMEILRIASIHSSNTFATGLSLVSALILGELSMSLNIFLPEVLLLTSFSSICFYATPNYELSLSNKFVSFILIILSLLFGYKGLLIGITILFMYLVSIKSFDLPYLYPVCPFNLDDFIHLFIRKKSKDKRNN